MKRLTTYYFLLLVFLNVLFALYLSATTAHYEISINKFLGGYALPGLTEWAIRHPWWPWVCAAVCAVGAMLSLWGKLKDNVLRHLLVITLFVEFGIMFLTVMVFTILWSRA